jgi:hypothetical protein
MKSHGQHVPTVKNCEMASRGTASMGKNDSAAGQDVHGGKD